MFFLSATERTPNYSCWVVLEAHSHCTWCKKKKKVFTSKLFASRCLVPGRYGQLALVLCCIVATAIVAGILYCLAQIWPRVWHIWSKVSVCCFYFSAVANIYSHAAHTLFCQVPNYMYAYRTSLTRRRVKEVQGFSFIIFVLLMLNNKEVAFVCVFLNTKMRIFQIVRNQEL